MARLVLSPVGVPPDAIVAIDLGRRVFLGLSRDERYLHIVHPRGYDQTDEDGNVVSPATDLVCTCRGGEFHGRCYQIAKVEALEAELDAPPSAVEVAWFGKRGLDSPAGAGEMVEASRG